MKALLTGPQGNHQNQLAEEERKREREKERKRGREEERKRGREEERGNHPLVLLTGQVLPTPLVHSYSTSSFPQTTLITLHWST
jgi:hypothetical protein